MIDSVTVFVNNCEKNQLIINRLRTYTTGFRKMRGQPRKTGTTLLHDVIISDKTYNERERFLYKTINVASSHYKVIAIVDKDKTDGITFTFSVPKYFYGHNIAQAINNVCEIDGGFYEKSIEWHLRNGYGKFMRYIRTFFKREFPGCPIDYTDIEIKRLDFCYNKIFQNKEQALEYLEVQKGVKKKYLRDDSAFSNNYKTSIFYSNDDYSVKIYHKGTEFAKNDYPKLEQINKERRANYFDVEYLQGFADRILRYEMTLRPSYISYLYNTKIFRKNSNQFKSWKVVYNKVKAIEKSEKERKEFILSSLEQDYKQLSMYCRNNFVSIERTQVNYLQFIDYSIRKTWDKDYTEGKSINLMRKFYQKFDELIHKKRKLFLKLTPTEFIQYNHDKKTNQNLFDTKKEIILDDELFYCMGSRLLEFIKDMEIKEVPEISEKLKLIDEYNSKIKFKKITKSGKPKEDSKIDKAKLGLLLFSLENNGLDHVCNMLGVSRSTKEKYKSDLKKIGITKNMIGRKNLYIPPNDFESYYNESIINRNKLFVNQVFRLED